MKRLGLILLVIVVVLGAFWVGLMADFPGAAVSRFVEHEVNRRQVFDLVLTPAELRWSGLYVARAELRRRDKPAAEPLFVLTDFSLPLTWRLVRGLPAHGAIGRDGRVEVFLPWSQGGEARLDGQVELGQVPLPEVLRPLAVEGRVDFRGRFALDADSQAGARLPTGTLESNGQDVVVSGVSVAGVELPPTRLEAVNMVLETGRTLNVRRLDYRGDLQGTVDGTITPNLRDPRNSLLALNITTAFRDSWLERLGSLRLVLQGFMDRGRVGVNLSGTVGQPQLRPVRGGG